MSAPRLLEAGALPAAELHAAFMRAFADYLAGPFRLELAQWPAFLARQGVDLALSRVLLVDGAVQAFALAAPRPQQARWRLASMGAVPAARGSGAATQLLDDMIARATAAAQRAVELEVFAQNERALRLYRSRGFEPLHELHGHLAAPGQVEPRRAALEQVAPAEALAWLDAAATALGGVLPLQVSADGLRAVPGLQAWRHGSAQLIFSQTADGHVAIASVFDPEPAQTHARALLHALRAAHPAARLQVPQLQRRDLGGQALRESGFETLALHQLLMLRHLPGAAPHSFGDPT